MPSVMSFSRVPRPVSRVKRTWKPTLPSPSFSPSSLAMRWATERADPARLGMADELPPPAVAELEQHLGDLRGLAGTGGACDDDHLVLADRGLDVLPALGDGQIPRIGQAQPGGCGG